MDITQSQFQALMQQEKCFEDVVKPLQLGPPPIRWKREVKGLMTKDKYFVDFWRGSIELSKYTINHRYRTTIILLRYDSAGRHTNPDGEYFDGPHVHLYREGYNDAYAFPIADFGINATDSLATIFTKVLGYCNITSLPELDTSLF